MKITDFGLWFGFFIKDVWHNSTTIPPTNRFSIYYDGECLGCKWSDLDLEIYDHNPHIVKLKNCRYQRVGLFIYKLERNLYLEDFEIVPNPDYRGN
jgi:hypothetical protein